MITLGAPTDNELLEELAAARPERREEIKAELDQREESRAAMRGHDPSLCHHPVRCSALR
jgi:hypothetical protein